MSGYTHAREHLHDCVELLLHAVELHVARFGHRMLQQEGRLSDLYVSLHEARQVLGSPGAGHDPVAAIENWPRPEEAHARFLACADRIVDRVARASVVLPIEELRLHAGLDEHALRLLLAAAAPALSVDLGRLFTFAWSDFTIKRPTIAFLAELIADDVAATDACVDALAPHGPLASIGLIELDEHPSFRAHTPTLAHLVSVPTVVVNYLQGNLRPKPYVDDGDCELTLPDEATDPDRLIIADEARREVLSALQRVHRSPRGRPRLVLLGPPGIGRRSFVAALTAGAGDPVMSADLAVLAEDESRFEARLRQLCCEARLRKATLVMRGDDFLDKHATGRLGRQLRDVLALHGGGVVMTLDRPSSTVHRLLGEVYEIPFAMLDSQQQVACWSQALEESEAIYDEGLAFAMSTRFHLTPGAIHNAVRDARAHLLLKARRRKAIHLDQLALHQAIRRQLDNALSMLAVPYATTLHWGDVVLPAETLAALQEIEMTAENRHKVYDQWGFRRKLAYGQGLSCLFSGPPGTGKTMMAGIIANTLGREIYRVELSRISSKWIGETEKNLGKLFDEAERAQVILLFDEADSLFSKRTRVESSNDRYANMEVNYLLQRMELFDGMTILTTNFELGLDEAFSRRIRFRVHFPAPGDDARRMLWQRVFPERAEIEDDIDWDVLARTFALTGGTIKNAALRAAFRAASVNRAITFRDLFDAALTEARELGMVVHDGSLQELD